MTVLHETLKYPDLVPEIICTSSLMNKLYTDVVKRDYFSRHGARSHWFFRSGTALASATLSLMLKPFDGVTVVV